MESTVVKKRRKLKKKHKFLFQNHMFTTTFQAKTSNYAKNEAKCYQEKELGIRLKGWSNNSEILEKAQQVPL